MKPTDVDDLLATVEDAVRRAYALGRADAMKRVMELAQSDDPGLRAVALLGPAEPAKPAEPARLEAPAEPPATAEADRAILADMGADGGHASVPSQTEAVQATEHQGETAVAEAYRPAQPVAPPPRRDYQPKREEERPQGMGSFLADYFYPRK